MSLMTKRSFRHWQKASRKFITKITKLHIIITIIITITTAAAAKAMMIRKKKKKNYYEISYILIILSRVIKNY